MLRFLQHTARLQPYDYCTNLLHTFTRFWDGWNPTGNTSAGRTRWFSGWRTCGGTFGDYALSLRHISRANVPIWIVNLDLSKGFRPSALASTMARSFRRRPSRTHDLDDPKFKSRPTGASCWQQWLQQVVCYTQWNPTRMRFKLPAVVFGVGNVDGELV